MIMTIVIDDNDCDRRDVIVSKIVAMIVTEIVTIIVAVIVTMTLIVIMTGVTKIVTTIVVLTMILIMIMTGVPSNLWNSSLPVVWQLEPKSVNFTLEEMSKYWANIFSESWANIEQILFSERWAERRGGGD